MGQGARLFWRSDASWWLLVTLLLLTAFPSSFRVGRDPAVLQLSGERGQSTADMIRLAWTGLRQPAWPGAEAARSYYTVLGVSRDATEREVKRAYLRLAKKYHPDKNREDKKAERKFRLIARAYEVLSDPEKRRVYDQLGEEGLSQHEQGGGQPGPFHGRPGQYQQFFFPGEGPFGQPHGANFHFSFQGNGRGPEGSFGAGFPFDDIFSEFFGGQHGGFRQQRTHRQGRRTSGFQRCEETKICSNGQCQTRVTCTNV
jgi:hypothetical protein